MSTVYKHRPLSNILARTAGAEDEEAQKSEQVQDSADEPKEDDLPEKYRGKSVADIVKMHQNAEQRLGQVQNEVGQLRGLVKDLAEVTRQPQTPTEPAEKLDLSDDDFFKHPAESVRKAVEYATKSKQEPEKPEIDVDFQLESNALIADFPDLEETVLSDDFKQFASSKPGRMADMQLAAKGSGVESVRAARRLLETYEDLRTPAESSPEQKPDPVEQAKKVANEGGRGKAPVQKDLMYEQDVIELIRKDPAKYRSPSFQKELESAIREKRFVKQ